MNNFVSLLVKTIVLVILYDLKCVHSRTMRQFVDMDNLQQHLDADTSLVTDLTIDICLDLETLHYLLNKTTPFSTEDCQSNFMESVTYKEQPPTAFVRCVYKSNIVYGVAPIEDPGPEDVYRLVVLSRIKEPADYLSYDLLENNSKEFSTINIPSGEYHVWTTLLFSDGRHTPWLRGPVSRSWNYTGETRHRSYKIQIKTEFQTIDGTSTVSAFVRWESFDAEDKCFDIRNVCDGRSIEEQILPNNGTSCELKKLPMGKTCELVLTGKYGVTRRNYRTPGCGDMVACVNYEKVQNLSLDAIPGSIGWDVFVSWTYNHQPIFFNVTFVSDHVKRSIQLPGNVTEVVFENVEDNGIYTVAVESVMENMTVHTSSRAQFPVEVVGWRSVGQALGGAWGALLCAGVASLAAALLWRRRRANRLERIYFPEPLGKPCKDAGDAADAEAPACSDAWELKSERLLLHEVVGEGAFGVVRRGTLEPAGKEVAVKMLKEFPTLDEIRSFRAEMELMKSVGAHPHVVSLVGCCSGRKPLIVVEYCSRGDLLSYLRCSWDVMVSKRKAKYYNNNVESTDYRNDLFKCQVQGENSSLVVNKLYDLQGVCDMELTTRDLLSFCRQIAMGMEFLASNRLVHRDLAARNILVSNDRTLKIADFGLSRDVYEENLYKQKGNGKMPMKWMAPESLTQRIYTSQSDVWSFGVVMWEVVSVGGSPYAGVPPARLPRLLRAGYRMPRPHNCCKPLYEVMLSCWRAHPRGRPTFSELHARLDELLQAHSANHYLALELDTPAAPPAPNNLKLYLKEKLSWYRGESYERPLWTSQSNHYSTPPASAYKLQSVS